MPFMARSCFFKRRMAMVRSMTQMLYQPPKTIYMLYLLQTGRHDRAKESCCAACPVCVNLVHPVFLSPVHDMGKAAVDTDFHGQHSADDALITVDVSGFHRQEIIDATATD